MTFATPRAGTAPAAAGARGAAKLAEAPIDASAMPNNTNRDENNGRFIADLLEGRPPHGCRGRPSVRLDGLPILFEARSHAWIVLHRRALGQPHRPLLGLEGLRRAASVEVGLGEGV